jgi:protein-S-isoprenylcysteine O-methyltransferase Ste14
MSTSTPLAAPLFELEGAAASTHLASWVSGISYTLGLLMVAQDRINVAPEQSPAISLTVVLVLVAIFMATQVAQRHLNVVASHLATTGIFSYSRNPIYMMFLLPLASLALLSLSAAVLAIAIYVTVMNLTVIRQEERDLSQAYGQKYADYAAKVPRWIL